MLNKLLTLALIVALTNGIHLKAQPPKPKKTEDSNGTNNNTNNDTETETNSGTEFNIDGVGSYTVESGMLGGGMLGSGSP